MTKKSPAQHMQAQRAQRAAIEARAAEIITQHPGLKGSKIHWSQAHLSAYILTPLIIGGSAHTGTVTRDDIK
jgi:hypothetical protein